AAAQRAHSANELRRTVTADPDASGPARPEVRGAYGSAVRRDVALQSYPRGNPGEGPSRPKATRTPARSATVTGREHTRQPADAKRLAVRLTPRRRAGPGR